MGERREQDGGAKGEVLEPEQNAQQQQAANPHRERKRQPGGMRRPRPAIEQDIADAARQAIQNEQSVDERRTIPGSVHVVQLRQ